MTPRADFPRTRKGGREGDTGNPILGWHRFDQNSEPIFFLFFSFPFFFLFFFYSSTFFFSESSDPSIPVTEYFKRVNRSPSLAHGGEGGAPRRGFSPRMKDGVHNNVSCVISGIYARCEYASRRIRPTAFLPCRVICTSCSGQLARRTPRRISLVNFLRQGLYILDNVLPSIVRFI